jgi:hypothetical protein
MTAAAMMTPKNRHAILAAAILAATAIVFLLPPIPQPLAYHSMADQRTLFGIPNFANVVSNLPFAIVGLIGLSVTLGSARSSFDDPWTRWPYVALFAGVTLTAFGSAWYHLAPDNARLVWDRLPMTIGFMGLLTAMISERVSHTAGRRLFGPLLLTGAASVFYWHWSEIQGAGDLRLYALVQFGSLLLIALLLILYPARQPGSRYLVAALAGYALSKLFESADAAVLSAGGFVSGHTLKHLVAAGSVAFIVRMLQERGVRSESELVVRK